jgi:hypothetical protein
MNIIEHYSNQVPDGIKVAAAVSAPALTFLGITVEEWTFILSGIVSVFFIIEKFPMFLQRMRQLRQYIREVWRRE